MSMNEPGAGTADSGFVNAQRANLAQRIRAAFLVGGIAFLVMCLTVEWPLYILASLIAFLGATELRKMLGHTQVWPLLTGLMATVGGVWALQHWMKAPYAALIAVGVGSLALWARVRRKAAAWPDMLIAAWLAGPIACALWLHNVSVDNTRLFSPNLLLLVTIPLWMGDSAAYFAGKRFGKHPLAPKISPKKTWEGAIANFLTCILTAWIVGSVVSQGFGDDLPWTASVAVGAVAGVLGQAGDLLQSLLKRTVGMKDSGDVIPGHGGILDRIDSFLLSSVPASLVLWMLARGCFT